MSTQNIVIVPRNVLNKFLKYSASLVAVHEQLEDFYIAQNPNIIKKLRQAHREYLAKKTVQFNKLKRKYV